MPSAVPSWFWRYATHLVPFSGWWVYFSHCHPNVVKNAPKPTALNQWWFGDISCLLTDAFSQRIVGPQVHSSLYTTGCLAAQVLRSAGRAATRCLHHSDRGRTR